MKVRRERDRFSQSRKQLARARWLYIALFAAPALRRATLDTRDVVMDRITKRMVDATLYASPDGKSIRYSVLRIMWKQEVPGGDQDDGAAEVCFPGRQQHKRQNQLGHQRAPGQRLGD